MRITLNKYLKNIISLFSIFLCSVILYSQENSMYILDDNYKEYIGFLLNKEQIHMAHPLTQPFKVNELSSQIDSSQTMKAFKNYINLLSPKENKYGTFVTDISSGIHANYEYASDNFDYYLEALGSYSYKNISLVYAYEVNSQLIDHPAISGSIGKLRNEVMGRSPTAYIEYSNDYMNVFYGRIKRNYGHINTTGLLLSDNPLAYDHFSFDFHNKIIKYSYIGTRLEDKYAYDIRDVDSLPEYDWYKRYLSVHKIELAFSNKVHVGFSESILYGGINQGFVASYINPANIFFLSKMAERNGLEEVKANASFGLEIEVKPVKGLSVYSQFLVDDMDFDKELRKKYPDRIGLYSRLSYVFPEKQIQLSSSYIRISNWTYTSFYTFGNYTYFGNSLGYPKNGFEKVSVTLDCYQFPSIIFSASALYQRAREQDMESAFIYPKTKFPIGVSQNIIGFTGYINYVPDYWIKAKLELGYSSIHNFDNIENNNKDFINVNLHLTLRGLFTTSKQRI